MQSGFADLAKSNPQAAASIDPTQMKSLANNSTLIHQLPAEVQHVVLQAFVNSFHVVFYAAAPITAIGFLLAMMLKEVPLRTNADYKQASEEVAGEQFG
jgi:ABC-type sugar transport system permease subunit